MTFVADRAEVVSRSPRAKHFNKILRIRFPLQFGCFLPYKFLNVQFLTASPQACDGFCRLLSVIWMRLRRAAKFACSQAARAPAWERTNPVCVSEAEHYWDGSAPPPTQRDCRRGSFARTWCRAVVRWAVFIRRWPRAGPRPCFFFRAICRFYRRNC